MIQEQFWQLTARDPIICRDGRPFGDGLRMRSLDWPHPSVMAGCVRSQLGYIDGGFANRSSSYLDALEQVQVAGPFGYYEGTEPELLFPAPRDVIFESVTATKTFRVHPIRPELDSTVNDMAGSNLPDEMKYVCLLPDDAGDFKPCSSPFLWSSSVMTQWLANTGRDLHPFTNREFSTWPNGLYEKPEVETRTHVSIAPGSGAAADGMLFQSSGIDLSMFAQHGQAPQHAETDSRAHLGKLRLSVRVRGDRKFVDKALGHNELVTLAGERRLIHARESNSMPQGWHCDPALASKLSNASRVRMVLATPAIFKRGWLPGWLSQNSNGEWEGLPPGLTSNSGARLRLVSAIVERWIPVSGFSYRSPYGPKPIRRMVPSGCVYFFEVVDGLLDQTFYMDHWMQSVSDCELDQTAGFGLALWGLW